MADCLSLLRYCNIKKRKIIECNDNIIFGDVSCKKDVKTSLRTLRSSRNRSRNEYYTLESVLFFFKNSKQLHTDYARRAVEQNIQVIDETICSNLLAYLCGDIDSCKYVDHHAVSQAPAGNMRAENSLLVDKCSAVDFILSPEIPHFGQTIVNDVKEEENDTSSCFHCDVKEEFFQSHYGETIVNDGRDIGSVGLFAYKHAIQACSVKDEPDITSCVAEKRIRLGETKICDIKPDLEDNC